MNSSVRDAVLTAFEALPGYDEFALPKQQYDFLPFEEARAFVRSLGLKNYQEWRDWYKANRPTNIPSGAADVYKDLGWISWYDWLGTEYLPFEEARTYVRSLGLKNSREWQEYFQTKRPKNIPSNPNEAYKDFWISWYDWLGVEEKPKMLPFEEARAFVRSRGFKNTKEWRDWTRPKNIPSNPNEAYKDFWISWHDWLGTENLPFKEAREFARSLNLKSKKEWQDWYKTNHPRNIPSNPLEAYEDSGWSGYPNWLGTENLPFKEARKFARSLNLKNREAWNKWWRANRPKNIPRTPNRYYKDKGWKDYADWLGSGYLPFKEARDFARSLGLTPSLVKGGQGAWYAWWKANRPKNLPSNPQQHYKDKGWKGIVDWLGYDVAPRRPRRSCHQFLPFEEARTYVRSLGLKNQRAWYAWWRANRPKNIPCKPEQCYKDKGWKGIVDWLGYDVATRRPRHQFLPFEEAKEIARSLGLKNKKAWYAWWRANRPKNLPSNPQQHYKDKGWVDWFDWLGKDK